MKTTLYMGLLVAGIIHFSFRTAGADPPAATPGLSPYDTRLGLTEEQVQAVQTTLTPEVREAVAAAVRSQGKGARAVAEEIVKLTRLALGAPDPGGTETGTAPVETSQLDPVCVFTAQGLACPHGYYVGEPFNEWHGVTCVNGLDHTKSWPSVAAICPLDCVWADNWEWQCTNCCAATSTFNRVKFVHIRQSPAPRVEVIGYGVQTNPNDSNLWQVSGVCRYPADPTVTVTRTVIGSNCP